MTPKRRRTSSLCLPRGDQPGNNDRRKSARISDAAQEKRDVDEEPRIKLHHILAELSHEFQFFKQKVIFGHHVVSGKPAGTIEQDTVEFLLRCLKQKLQQDKINAKKRDEMLLSKELTAEGSKDLEEIQKVVAKLFELMNEFDTLSSLSLRGLVIKIERAHTASHSLVEEESKVLLVEGIKPALREKKSAENEVTGASDDIEDDDKDLYNDDPQDNAVRDQEYRRLALISLHSH
ncbi:MAG: hypothetical protein Q9220_004152 [cf. Caloplaca sp. 1 TL-2023]